ncbi:MAG: carbohydrate ABC transporter permease [Chloroflexota bacterium]
MGGRGRPVRISPAVHLILAPLVLINLVPLYFMAANSLKTGDAYLDAPLNLPLEPTLANFRTALDAGFARWFLNSVLVTAGSAALSLVVAAPPAYALTWLTRRRGTLIARLIASLMILPPIVVLIPLYQTVASLGLLNTRFSVTLVYAGLMFPFTTFLLYNFFRSIPRELLEAAALDGGGRSRAFVEIVLPLSRPVLITAAVVNGLWAWNELLIALVFLQREELRTLMVGIATFQSKYNLNIPATMAGLLLATFPVLLVYIVGQRSFVAGLIAGALRE